MEGIVQTLSGLIGCQLLAAEVYDDKDRICKMIEGREGRDFDDAWIRSFRSLSDTRQDDQAAVRLIREQAFKSAYEKTGSSDIAAFVSDDFELIVRAALTGSEDKWVAGLRDAYASGGFPCQLSAGCPIPL